MVDKFGVFIKSLKSKHLSVVSFGGKIKKINRQHAKKNLKSLEVIAIIILYSSLDKRENICYHSSKKEVAFDNYLGDIVECVVFVFLENTV